METMSAIEMPIKIEQPSVVHQQLGRRSKLTEVSRRRADIVLTGVGARRSEATVVRWCKIEPGLDVCPPVHRSPHPAFKLLLMSKTRRRRCTRPTAVHATTDGGARLAARARSAGTRRSRAARGGTVPSSCQWPLHSGWPLALRHGGSCHPRVAATAKLPRKLATEVAITACTQFISTSRNFRFRVRLFSNAGLCGQLLVLVIELT